MNIIKKSTQITIEEISQLLDEKLDQKFDEKLQPIKNDISIVRSDLVAMEGRLDKKFLKLFDFLDTEVMKDRKRIMRLEDEAHITP